MKIRNKIVLIFAAGLVLLVALVAIGLPRIVARISVTQLYSLARTLGSYLVHDLETLPYSGDSEVLGEFIDSRLGFVQSLGETSGNYHVRSAILIGPDYRVEIGYPDSEVGNDYSAHEDVREAMAETSNVAAGGDISRIRTVLEAANGASKGSVTDADIVSPIRLPNGEPRVLEIKLDFTKTLALLNAQYAQIRLAILALIVAGMVLIAGVIIGGTRRTILKPVLAISAAMERVGTGDLEAKVGVSSSDEIGLMARRFDEMTTGLRERFQLQHYVSKSTVDAARGRAEYGNAYTPVQRKKSTVFFSDIRGFTSYTESTDPERVVSVLNELLGMQEIIVTKAGGEVDKFVGDETMAVFPTPERAIAAALVIRSKVERMGKGIDNLKLGFGIHTGELLEGDIGSQSHMDHTVIGDTVNTAARLQEAAKAGQILVSAAVAYDPAVTARYTISALGALSVKGKSEPVEVFSVDGSAQIR